MEALKKKNTLQDRNSRKASFKNWCKKSITQKRAAVNEAAGMVMAVLGMVCIFGRWDDPKAQAIGLTAAVVLMFGGVFVALGGKE